MPSASSAPAARVSLAVAADRHVIVPPPLVNASLKRSRGLPAPVRFGRHPGIVRPDRSPAGSPNRTRPDQRLSTRPGHAQGAVPVARMCWRGRWNLAKKPAMTYIAKPKFHHPAPAEERARLYPSRLRGLDLDAVRRLRPRLDLGRDHRGLLRARDRAASRREAFRHRLLVEDADLFPRQVARLQFGARPHALGADRRQSRQPRPDLSRRLGRRRLAPRSASASSRMRSGAASTWSISSRTTACTA